ncbi:MAG: hypothetical protein AB7E85_01140 [Pseudobdellovibrionaceae bacterium]
MKTNTKEQAIDAYIRKVAHIDAMLRRLQGACDDHFHNNPDDIHWGHVGDVSGIEESLQRICDSVFKEGEHAPENNA